MKLNTNVKSLFLVIMFLSTYNTSYAQGDADLAKAAQNPIANMISLPFQDNINTGIGPDDETQNILNIQPVWPISLNDDWNLITRTIFPVISQPDVLTGDGRINGLGDTSFSAYILLYQKCRRHASIWQFIRQYLSSPFTNR